MKELHIASSLRRISLFNVIAEEATFNFDDDYMVYIPYVRGGKNKKVEDQFFNSFENIYTHVNLSEMGTNQLAFTPVVVELKDGKKLCIAESDVESYPGMFVRNANQSNSLKGVFAPYPKETVQGGHNKLQKLVTAREDYIAKCSGRRSFPGALLLYLLMIKSSLIMIWFINWLLPPAWRILHGLSLARWLGNGGTVVGCRCGFQSWCEQCYL